MTDKILNEVKKTIEKYGMFNDVGKAVIGFSSGPDSVCLIDVLKKIYDDKINFFLVYVNHGLRSKEVLRREEELTAYYARKYNCGFEIMKIEIPRTKKGIEAEARERRHNILVEYARKISAQRIVLGHNLDDLIETFFLNLIRGSGNIGLQSIPPVRLPFVRPLINTKKVDILRYLRMRRLRFSEDLSNLDTNIRRNYIRQKIIPEFIKLNPRIYETIKREIEILHNDEEFLQKAVARVYKKLVEKKGCEYILDLNHLMYYNKTIGNRVIMRAIMELKGDLEGIESKHIEAIRGLKDKKSGRKLTLPYDLYAQKIYDRVLLGFVKKEDDGEFFIEIGIGESLRVKNLIVRTEVIEGFDLKEKDCEFFDLSEVSPPLVLRNRRPGDVVAIKNGTKKLKEILNEKRVPVNQRNEVVVLCDEKGILWMPGIYRAYRAYIGENTRKILKVKCEHID